MYKLGPSSQLGQFGLEPESTKGCFSNTNSIIYSLYLKIFQQGAHKFILLMPLNCNLITLITAKIVQDIANNGASYCINDGYEEIS